MVERMISVHRPWVQPLAATAIHRTVKILILKVMDVWQACMCYPGIWIQGQRELKMLTATK